MERGEAREGEGRGIGEGGGWKSRRAHEGRAGESMRGEREHEGRERERGERARGERERERGGEGERRSGREGERRREESASEAIILTVAYKCSSRPAAVRPSLIDGADNIG